MKRLYSDRPWGSQGLKRLKKRVKGRGKPKPKLKSDAKGFGKTPDAEGD